MTKIRIAIADEVAIAIELKPEVKSLGQVMIIRTLKSKSERAVNSEIEGIGELENFMR